jgi:hypothetical protein
MAIGRAAQPQPRHFEADFRRGVIARHWDPLLDRTSRCRHCQVEWGAGTVLDMLFLAQQIQYPVFPISE